MSDSRVTALADELFDEAMAAQGKTSAAPGAFDFMIFWPIIQQIIAALIERWKQRINPVPVPPPVI